VKYAFVRRVLLAVFTVAAGGGLVYVFLPAPAAVDLAAAGRGPLRLTVDQEGKTRIKERYVITAPLAGQMPRIPLKAGDPVEAGKTLLTVIEPVDPALLDDRARSEQEARVKRAEAARLQAQANLKRARATLDYAEKESRRQRTLLQTRSASQSDLDNAVQREQTAAQDVRAGEFGVQVADFELEQAKAALLRSRPHSPGDPDWPRLEVRAPISGKVLHVYEENAEVLTAGTKLVELGDPADLECEIDVLSTDAVKIAPGAKVFLEHWGGERPLLGRVRRVEPAGFTKTSALGVEEQRVWVRVDFTEPLEVRQQLGDAYRVEARIVIWEAENVLKVPAGALFRHDGGWAVFVATEGKAVLRPVRIGHSNGLEAEVLGGLAEGEQVVLHPGDKLKDGSAIAPR
jgi:HlyD family secretion protein